MILTDFELLGTINDFAWASLFPSDSSRHTPSITKVIPQHKRKATKELNFVTKESYKCYCFCFNL